MTKKSRLYRSPAWPDPADPPFVNAAITFETALSPQALLASLHAVEAGFGRRRTKPNAPRTLDLDLLDYRGLVIDEGDAGGLVLPHPRIEGREFVLAPLVDLAPDWRSPASGHTAAHLLAAIKPRQTHAVADDW